MSAGNAWPIQKDAADWVRQTSKRLSRAERMQSPISAATLLGPGMSSQAVNVIDFNDEVATFNGFFFAFAGASNAPVIEVLATDPETGMPTGSPTTLPPMAWTFMTVAREDGTGMQYAWNTDVPESMLSRIRNFWPNPDDPTAPVVFGDWLKWATSSGFIGGDDLDPEVQDGISTAYQDAQDALAAADEAIDFALSSNAVFRQATAPVDGVDGDLRVNDTWFDTDDGNKPYTWNGSAWVDATSAWLTTNPTGTFPNVVISPAGLAAYNASGTVMTSISSTTGIITTTGSVFVAGDISGSTVTGGTVQTSASASVGIKMNSAGFVAYNSSGSPTFSITASTGAVAMLGNLISGSSITGTTITGSTFTTTGGSDAISITAGVAFFGTAGKIYSNSLGFWLERGDNAMGFMNGGNVFVNVRDVAFTVNGWGGTPNYLTVDGSGTTVRNNLTVTGGGATLAGNLVMGGNSINSVDAINNGGGIINVGGTWRATSPGAWVGAGGQAIAMQADGDFVIASVPSRAQWKTDIEPVTVDRDALAALDVITWRYRDDVPFKADPTELFYGYTYDQAESLGLDRLIDVDPYLELEVARPERLPYLLLAAWAEDHRELVELKRQVEALSVH